MSVPTSRQRLGAAAERAVAEQLVAQGYTIVARNARAGRLELDIVATRGRQVVVCEVRARSHARFIHPADTLTRAKRDRVRRGAFAWLATRSDLRGWPVRFDAAAVVDRNGRLEIEYYEACF